MEELQRFLTVATKKLEDYKGAFESIMEMIRDMATEIERQGEALVVASNNDEVLGKRDNVLRERIEILEATVESIELKLNN